MAQKILAGRTHDAEPGTASVRIEVDQVILSREPAHTLAEAWRRGLSKATVETALAYETHCITSPSSVGSPTVRIPRGAIQAGILVARAGIGFPGAVHLERFAAPGRLALTDDLRLASLGAVGMLTLVTSPRQLADALLEGVAKLRAVRSVQLLLSGKLRPFSCAKDAALELLSRGLAETVRKLDHAFRAPVVLEFSGPGARLLSVPERAVLCSLAPCVGAAGAVFVSDDRTEAYLREQRRSKAHRPLLPDPGAPSDEVMTLDLSTVDPLVLDATGAVRPPRELAGTSVAQVILGGDSGASLRDLLAAAALLKSKRIPSSLEFLIAPPSRQTLEVLARTGALVDLIATGARVLEPDHRVLTQELYPAPKDGVSLRTFDSMPGTSRDRRPVVASAETLAYAVATGTLGDPRGFKRPARVTVPRALPTDDALIVRKERKTRTDPKSDTYPPRPATPAAPFQAKTELAIHTEWSDRSANLALVAQNLDAVCWAASNAPALAPSLRALISPVLLAAMVPRLSGAGVLALSCSEAQLEELRAARTLELPRLSTESSDIEVSIGKNRMTLSWLASEDERRWVLSGLRGKGS